MPVASLIPLSSECHVCGHPIRWTHSFEAAPGTHQEVFPPRPEKTVLPQCLGGCGRTVNDHHYPCDSCWDRLPVNLKRGLLLSLAGVEVNSARVAIAAYFRNQPAPLRTDQPCATGAQDLGAPS